MITFVCWKWRQPNHRTTYTAEHVNIWTRGIQRVYRHPARYVCVTDDPTGILPPCETFPIWRDMDGLVNPSGAHLPSCYRRLKIFSPLVTSEMDVGEGEEIVSIDLDVVFVDDVAPLFVKRPDDDFVGWRGVGSYNPVVYNGTIFKFRAGTMNFLWDDFDPKTSPKAANDARYFGSDQGWLSFKLAGRAPGWGARDGVLSYTSDVRSRAALPGNARLVSFNGKRKPWEAGVNAMSPWIAKYWSR